MSFTNDVNSATDRIRVMVGDTSVENEFLSDDWYTYYLTQADSNERLAAISAAKAILSQFTSSTRARLDQLEVYENQQFDQYLKWLKDFIENPSISGLLSPVPYASGISKDDMRDNRLVIDNNRPPIGQGFIEEGCVHFTNNYNRLIDDC